MGNDGSVAPMANGFQVSTVFNLTAPPTGAIPGDLDHVKWLYWANGTSLAGYPGIDTQPGHVNECSAKVGGSITGTQSNPFGVKANSPNLGMFGVTAGDFETNMIFDFVVTNDAFYALYERLPFVRSQTYNYASFTYLINVGNRRESDTHELKVSYDASSNSVDWYINGKKVYTVNRIGRYIGTSEYPAIDRGGADEDVKLRQFACGIGAFTLLDGYEKTLQKGLVKLNPADGYYQNPKNPKKTLEWIDEESKDGSRIWGQGVEAKISDYRAARVPKSP